MIGRIYTRTGPVPQISSTLVWADRFGRIKARWGIGRMHYTVDPGLYALGNPQTDAPVLVTANYKMSFDRLRESLYGRDAWILVLDTKGINVWCAAGKGTFGTEELLGRMASTGLSHIVDHRELILPQLSAPGVAAHEVHKQSGFRVVYGPIRSGDLPSFLDAGFKATPEMRKKSFGLRERMALVPVELVGTLKWSLILLPCIVLAGGFGGKAGFWNGVSLYGTFAGTAFLCAILSGAVLTPMLLPWLPGRAFSLKGLVMGLITTLFLAALWPIHLNHWTDAGAIVAWFFLVPSLSAYLAMNFTGASTYTSLSGVRKEMKWAVPFQIAGGAVGLCTWIITLIAA